MNTLVKRQGNSSIVDAKIEEAFIVLVKEQEMIEASLEKLKEQIKAAMCERGIVALKTDRLHISYVQASERETFDKKRFQAEMPDLYDEYVEFKPVADSIRIKVLNNEKDSN